MTNEEQTHEESEQVPGDAMSLSEPVTEGENGTLSLPPDKRAPLAELSEEEREERLEGSFQSWSKVESLLSRLAVRKKWDGADGAPKPSLQECTDALNLVRSEFALHADALTEGATYFKFDKIYESFYTLFHYHDEESESAESIERYDVPYDPVMERVIDRVIARRARECACDFLDSNPGLLQTVGEGAFRFGWRAEEGRMILDDFVDAAKASYCENGNVQHLRSVEVLGEFLEPVAREVLEKNLYAEQLARANGTWKPGQNSTSHEQWACMRDNYDTLFRMGNRNATEQLVAHYREYPYAKVVLNNAILHDGIEGYGRIPPPVPPSFEVDPHFAWANEKSGTRVARNILNSYGLPAEEYLPVWESAAEIDFAKQVNDFPNTVVNNLQKISMLEKHREGAAQELTQDFGIRVYSRYSDAVLKKQLEQADDIDHEYGVTMSAYADYNGAFRGSLVSTKLSEQAEQQGMHLRVIECGSKEDITKRLLALQDRYGKQQQIGFLWVNGHGNPESIQFGNGESGMILAEDIFGRGEGRSSLVLKDDAPISLLSCSTGAPGGIAAQIAAQYEKEVTAPTVVSYGVKDFSLHRDEQGKLHFAVVFRGAGDSDGITAVHHPIPDPE